jgi:hypothetical protein
MNGPAMTNLSSAASLRMLSKEAGEKLQEQHMANESNALGRSLRALSHSFLVVYWVSPECKNPAELL